MITKLDFKLTLMNGQNVYLAEPYKVVHFDYSDNSSSCIERENWRAYHRIMCPISHKWLFGNAVEHVQQFKSVEYSAKEQAMNACQKHFESESGQQLLIDHAKYFKRS
jgi:hypothetical protein